MVENKVNDALTLDVIKPRTGRTHLCRLSLLSLPGGSLRFAILSLALFRSSRAGQGAEVGGSVGSFGGKGTGRQSGEIHLRLGAWGGLGGVNHGSDSDRSGYSRCERGGWGTTDVGRAIAHGEGQPAEDVGGHGERVVSGE
jgi:hypothetical protein